MIKDWLSKLTDQYKKNESSNIGKLLTIIDIQIESLKGTLKDIEEWRNIHNAKGKTLDYIGENIGQQRGKASDEIYKVMIRGKESLNSADGTINKMISSLSNTLDCKPSEIHVLTLKETGENEPAALVVKKAPLDALNRVGMSTGQFLQIAQNSAAGGVRVATVNLEGTFRFSSNLNAIEISPQGFSSNGVDGGTLGSVFVPEEEIELPI